MNTGKQEYRNTGIQEYRNTEIQDFLNTGIQEYMNTEIKEYKNTGIQLRLSKFVCMQLYTCLNGTFQRIQPSKDSKLNLK